LPSRKVDPLLFTSFLQTLIAYNIVSDGFTGFASRPLCQKIAKEFRLAVPDLILHHANVYTVDKNLPRAEAVAVCGNLIKAVGRNAHILPLAGSKTRLVNLDGRLLLPGLCDAHIHLYYWSLARKLVDFKNCRSREEMLNRIRLWLETAPPEMWASGWGWNESSWPDIRLPTRHDLDAVTGPTRPAIFWRSDMHAAVANSAALKIAGITPGRPDPEGGIIGRDESGRPNGLLLELAINLVLQKMPDFPEPFLDQALTESMAELNRLGITAVHDQRMKDQEDGPPALAAYQRLHQEDALTLRINCNIAAHHLHHLSELRLYSGFGDNYLRLGHIKLFTDGSMGSRTAWMLAPYEPDGSGGAAITGVNVTPPDEIAATFRRAVEAGFPISIHAIGDRANRTVLDIFEELVGSGPQPPIPHRIEHVQIIDPADLARLAQLKITASVQPLHITDDMETADHVLGRRADRVYRFRSLIESGALLALGSDAPVADPNPFLGIHAAVCRQKAANMAAGAWYGDERLTIAQTIEGYTLGAAKAAGWDDVIGTITPGKLADIVVLDRDLFALEARGITGSEIAETEVFMTLFDGRIIHEK
jgi:predicted amidohydrolase YtcJ